MHPIDESPAGTPMQGIKKNAFGNYVMAETIPTQQRDDNENPRYHEQERNDVKDHMDKATNMFGSTFGKNKYEKETRNDVKDHVDEATNQFGSTRGNNQMIMNMKEKATAPSKLSNIKEYNRWSKQMTIYFKAIGVIGCLQHEIKENESSEFIRQWDMFIEENGQDLDEDEIRLMKKIFKRKWSKDNLSQDVVNDQMEQLTQNKILSGISNDIYSVIQHCNSAADMWTTLKNHCMGEASGERLILRQRFDQLQIPSSQPMQKFFTEYRNLLNDMKQLSIEPGEFEQCSRILNLLPSGTYRDFCSNYRYNMKGLTSSGLLQALRTESVRLQNWDTPHSQRRKDTSYFNGIERGDSDRGRGDRRRG